VNASVVIATYNSQQYLNSLFANLNNQTNVDLEIIIVDGGSNDKTVDIAKKFGATVLFNEKRDPINAKWIGFCKARYDYVLFMDHDEILVSPDSISRKCRVFESNIAVPIVFSSGYSTKSLMTAPNLYTTLYGDPVSRYFYQFPNNEDRLVRLKERIFFAEKSDYLLFTGKHKSHLLCLLETSSMSVALNRSLLQSSGVHLDASSLPIIYYKLIELDCQFLFAILKDDIVEHKSSSTWAEIRTKILWRIANQANSNNELNEAGLGSRFEIESKAIEIELGVRVKSFKEMQFRYVFSRVMLLPALAGSIALAKRTRNWKMLWSLHLDYFVLLAVLAVAIKKLLVIEPKKLHYSKE
jgi:glycosyltransferase involved in cell wall biosynthesis